VILAFLLSASGIAHNHIEIIEKNLLNKKTGEKNGNKQTIGEGEPLLS